MGLEAEACVRMFLYLSMKERRARGTMRGGILKEIRSQATLLLSNVVQGVIDEKARAMVLDYSNHTFQRIHGLFGHSLDSHGPSYPIIAKRGSNHQKIQRTP